jgi:hypothetical protein
MVVEGHYFFRVTRDADLELRDLEADDLMLALQEGLRKRRLGGEVVRLEVANEMPQEVVDLLIEGTAVQPQDLYRINGPLGLDDLMSLQAVPLPQLKDRPFMGRTAPALARAQRSQLEDGSIKPEEFTSIFSVLRRGDVLLCHPFDLFSTSVEEFINQAADDPSVLAIKMTLYRTSKNSPIIAALTRQIIADLWAEYRDELTAWNISPARRVATLLWDARFGLLTVILAGFGRAAAEVGAVMIVGGNIDGVTRTMTTAIALETSKGNLALALGLGAVLIAVVTAVNAAAWGLRRVGEAKAG